MPAYLDKIRFIANKMQVLHGIIELLWAKNLHVVRVESLIFSYIRKDAEQGKSTIIFALALL